MLKTDLHPPHRVTADVNKLRQVLINLLGNAVKFTTTGQVQLRISSQEGQRICFEVIDSGPGISADRLEAVFDPFQQGDPSIQGGTGLGLSIARGHVELMGGRLQVDSQMGRGARFYFTVELPPFEGEPTIEARDLPWDRVSALASGSTVSALVVDDVVTNRDILARLLQRIGVQVAVAEDGTRALEQARAALPDIIFLDIRMPGPDGTEVFARLIEEHGKAAITCVAISASVLEHERQRCLEAGFDAFLGKPFRSEEIFACLSTLLGVEFDFDPASEVAAQEPPPSTEAVILPRDLYDGLHEAASLRNVTELDRRLAGLEELGADGADLAAHLRRLIRLYDMKGIRALLENTRPD